MLFYRQILLRNVTFNSTLTIIIPNGTSESYCIINNQRRASSMDNHDIRQYHGKVLSRITPRIYSQNRGLWAEMNGTMDIFKFRPRTSNASGRLRQRKRTKEETVDNRIICSHFNKKKTFNSSTRFYSNTKNSCLVNWTFICIYNFFTKDFLYTQQKQLVTNTCTNTQTMVY